MTSTNSFRESEAHRSEIPCRLNQNWCHDVSDESISHKATVEFHANEIYKKERHMQVRLTENHSNQHGAKDSAVGRTSRAIHSDKDRVIQSF